MPYIVAVYQLILESETTIRMRFHRANKKFSKDVTLKTNAVLKNPLQCTAHPADKVRTCPKSWSRKEKKLSVTRLPSRCSSSSGGITQLSSELLLSCPACIELDRRPIVLLNQNDKINCLSISECQLLPVGDSPPLRP